MSTPRSAVKKMKSANPIFNQTVTVDIVDPTKEKLHLAFFDMDDTETPVLIGETKISLQHLKKGVDHSTWYRLVNCLSGDVHISLTPVDFDTNASPAVAPQPIPTSGTSSIPLAGWPPQMAPSQPSSYSPAPAYPLPMASPTPAVSPSGMYHQHPHHHQYGVGTPAYQPPAPRPALGAKPGVVNPNDLLMTADSAISRPQTAPSIPQLDPKSIQRDFPHIAKGSFGVVFTGRVHGISLDKVVIKDMEVHNQRNIDDWKKEIAMMARMRSPYVVEVLGYCSSGHILTIVMEYMRKGSLYDVLHQRKEPLSLLQRMRMARQCALSVAHLHAAAVIHRDIKSMNILCTEEYICKLTDFGCAKLINDRTIFNTANSGTPLWMAPEVRAGQYDYSADVYSLGLVLFELFENKLPFYDQLRQCVVLPKQFQSGSVVLPCVAAKPGSRPTAAQVVKVLDMMIRNVVGKVRKHLPPEEEYLLFSAPSSNTSVGDQDVPDDFDADLKRLYTHLLTKNPAVVDQLIARVFNHAPPSSSSQTPVSAAPLQNSADDLLNGYHPSPGGASPGIRGNSSPTFAAPVSTPVATPSTQYYLPPTPPPASASAPSYAPSSSQHQVAAYPPVGAPTTSPSLLAGIPVASPVTGAPRISSGVDDLLNMDVVVPISSAPISRSTALSAPIAAHRSSSPSASGTILYPSLDANPVQTAKLKDWEVDRLANELNNLSIYDLRNLLYNHNIDESHCFSKADLVDLAKRSDQALQLYKHLVRTPSSDVQPIGKTVLSTAETSRVTDMFNVYSEGANEISRELAVLVLTDLLRGRMSESSIRQKAMSNPSMAASVSRDLFLSLYQQLLNECQILM